MVRAIALLAACLSGAGYGQSPLGPQFEVASIKQSAAGSDSSSGIRTGHGRLDANNVTLMRCILGAYGVGPHQVSGGPEWLNSERFQISAKADQPINDDAVLMVMLQGLLADRFALVFHRETRIITALVLEVGKNGSKLEKAEGGEASNNTSNKNSAVTIESHYTDMDAFARVLARQTDLPVVNNTGLNGTFNFKLHWIADNAKPAEVTAAEGPSLFSAIQEQLGLRLRSEKSPVEILVIESVKKPSEN